MQDTHETPQEQDARFGQLLVRVKAGSESAARQFIEAYGPYILRVVRRRLHRRMRSRFDSIDFVQAVWTSFFARRQELGQFTRPEEMFAYLGAVAANKVIDEARSQLDARRHDVRREVHLETESPLHEAALAARQPTPSEAVATEEFWECLLEGQPSHVRRILNLRREGIPYEQIARQLGIAERTVQRVVERLVSTRLPWATPN